MITLFALHIYPIPWGSSELQKKEIFGGFIPQSNPSTLRVKQGAFGPIFRVFSLTVDLNSQPNIMKINSRISEAE